MNQKFLPVGVSLLVLPVESEEYKTENQLVVVQNDLREGLVIEVGSGVSDIYKSGDKILFSKNAGVGQYYQKKAHLWLDGRGFPDGDVRAITQRKPIPSDKEDSL